MDAKENIVERLKQWIEDKGIYSPSDYGTYTPDYIYKMWNGEVSPWQIKRAIMKVA